jgi:putative spermidine/putrescine transport system permease protein
VAVIALPGRRDHSDTVNHTTPSLRSRAVPLLLAGTLLGVPIVVGVSYLVAGALGLVGNATSGGVTRVLADGAVLRSALLSLWIATIGTALATTGALAVALAFGGNNTLDRLARRSAVLPLPVPMVAAAVAVLLLLSQSGWLARVAARVQLISAPADFPALVYDPFAIGVIVAVVWKELPFLLLLAASLLSLRGTALTDAARTLGATRWQTVRRITLPMLLRGMAPSIVAVFVFVLGSLELPLVLAPSSPLALPMLMQERRQALDMDSHGEAYVIALLATVLALLAAVAHEWLRDDA